MAAKKRAPKAPKVRGGGRYSESEYFSFIRSGLRAKSNRWPVKYDVLNAAKRPYKGPNKRQKFEWQCNVCKKWVVGKEISIDHITPAGSLKCFADLPRFVETLLCEADNLQAICSVCHHAKTQQERKARNDN